MTTQPTALRLASGCDAEQLATVKRDILMNDAAAELRRLHAANLDCIDWYNDARAEVEKLEKENEALRADAERYRWLSVNAYVGIAPHPKPHEVWCLRLPNPSDCSNLNAAIDAAMKDKK